MQLKTLLREYLEEKGQVAAPRYDFLPSFKRETALPIEAAEVSWSRTDDSLRVIRFDRRSDLQDFVNAYLELEEERGMYAQLLIDGFEIRISSESTIDKKFKELIDEIAREIRGH